MLRTNTVEAVSPPAPVRGNAQLTSLNIRSSFATGIPGCAADFSEFLCDDIDFFFGHRQLPSSGSGHRLADAILELNVNCSTYGRRLS